MEGLVVGIADGALVGVNGVIDGLKIGFLNGWIVGLLLGKNVGFIDGFAGCWAVSLNAGRSKLWLNDGL